MRLVFLGTGAAVPTKKRAHVSIALKIDGEVLLFDCGENAQRQMMFTEVSPMKINNIFISHLHGDHILGIPGLLQSMAFSGRKEGINIYGPVGTKDMIIHALSIGYHGINFKINVYEISSKDPIKIIDSEKFEIYAFPVKHSVPSYAYIFKEKKKPRLDMNKAKALGVKVGPDLKRLKEGIPVKLENGRVINPEDVLLPPKKGICIAYSGDTIPIEEFGKFLRELGCRVLIHEATYDSTLKENAIETLHSTIEDAIKIAEIAGVETLILTHISARYDDISIYEKEVKEYKGNINIVVAEDFMVYDLKKKTHFISILD
ncbi:ribonuclease Z [Methanotorris formicicus]|uniref:Ribonuclease Z n=1 Tax=Methanotorris formicicus Mc-S-70 TaxID=647171 RepID=H1L0M3_9EURY|nr:ribonuclease Z [Methanotorris formicicus]EHP84640.1 ribonuclease Z [Methanotorris formicicus Mc-S-70]